MRKLRFATIAIAVFLADGAPLGAAAEDCASLWARLLGARIENNPYVLELNAAAEAQWDAIAKKWQYMREHPGETAKRAAVDFVLAVPRRVIDFVEDMGALYGSFNEGMVTAEGARGKLRRIFVMRRENPGHTNVMDFIRDPFTGILQPEAVRSRIGQVLGREIAAPTWTLSEPVGLLVSGGILSELISIPISNHTDRKNKKLLDEMRKKQPIGFTAFDIWYHAKQFPTHTSALSFYSEFREQVSGWVRGDIPVLPSHLDYLEHGYFGDLRPEELARLRDLLTRIPGLPSVESLELELKKLNAKELSAFQRLMGFEEFVRSSYHDSVIAHNTLVGEVNSGKKSVDAYIPFDAFVQDRLRRDLQGHPVFGDAKRFPSSQLEFLAEALNPHVRINGKSDLEWRIMAARAAENPRDPSRAQQLLAGAWRDSQAMRRSNPKDPWQLATSTQFIVHSLEALSTRNRAEAQKLARAKRIDSFCGKPDCGDVISTLARADYSGFDKPAVYFDGNAERPLNVEMDYWALMFEDPRFLRFAAQKRTGIRSDFELLSEFTQVMRGYSELNRLQSQAFAAADRRIAPRVNRWREDDSIDIPKPGMLNFCQLLGYAKEFPAPNALFRSMRTQLEGLRKKLSAEKWRACRLYVGGGVWDYHALEGLELAKAGKNQSATELDDLLSEIQERGQGGFRDILQDCETGTLPAEAYEKAKGRELLCELD